MYKATVLLSGGIDFSVLLALLKDQGVETTPFFVDYGQITAEREFKAAIQISKKMGFKLEKISAPNCSKITVNQLTSPKTSQNPFYPNRNLMLLTFGSIHAYENKHHGVAMGVIKAIGTTPFPDLQQVFFHKSEHLISISLDYELAILTPFIEMSKEEVVEIGKKLNVPLELTYSCLASNDNPCGKCESCLSRKEVMGEF